jgi:hypothetical protein
MRAWHSLRVAFFLAALAPPTAAYAQTSPPSPVVAPLPPPIGWATPAAPADATSGDALGLPMRMSMLSSLPSGAPAGGCSQPSVDAAGTILPVQPYVRAQLTMRLTLEMVSNLGCPGDPYAAFDTGVGASLSYAAPLRPNLWLVAGAGTYTTSTRGSAALTGVDLVWKQPSGRTTSVGVGTVSTSRATRAMARVGGRF